AVGERAGDGKAVLQLAGGDAQVAGRRDHRRAARAHPGNGGNGRHRAALELGEHAFHARLVGDAVSGRGEVPKQRNVRARRERPPTRAGDDDSLDGAAEPDLAKDRTEAVVHVEGERVVGGRTVKGDVADAVADLVEEVAVSVAGIVHGWARLLAKLVTIALTPHPRPSSAAVAK